MLAVVVATQIGDDDLAAFQVVFQIWNLLALILDEIAIAAQAMVAKALGAGDERVARSMATRLIDWSIVWGVVLGGAVVALRTAPPHASQTMRPSWRSSRSCSGMSPPSNL